MYRAVQMHGLVMCLLGSQLIPTGATQTYCALKICCGDEDKNSKGLGDFLGEKLHFKSNIPPHRNTVLANKVLSCTRTTCTNFIYVRVQFGGESQMCRSSIVGFKEINKNNSKQLVETIMLFTESLADCTESYENNPFN